MAKDDLQMDLFTEEDKTVEEVGMETVVEGADNDAIDTVEQEIPRPYKGTDGQSYSEEEWNAPVIQDGPTRREIEEWKQKYGKIYFVPFDGDVFIWRTLNRLEYRDLINNQEISMLDREELMTDKCVLFPRNFEVKNLVKGNAGVPSLLSEMIMDKSGFVAQTAPIKL